MKLTELAEKRIHFIGLGGAGMSGIARIMLAKGINISGSDAKDSSVLSGLKTLGAQVFIGHAASNIGDAEVGAGDGLTNGCEWRKRKKEY